MSLINDALRRARDAQAQAPETPATELQFRPVEPPPTARHGLGLALPLGLGGVALLALLLMWWVVQNRSATERFAAVGTSPSPLRGERAGERAGERGPSASAPVQVSNAQDSGLGSEGPRGLLSPALSSEGGEGEESSVRASQQSHEQQAVQATPEAVSPVAQVSPETNAPVVAEPPKPPALKLHAILFDSTRPSIMVNSKTLFVGDRVGELRVAAISRDRALLEGAGQTNVLILGE
jgi:hypothetical protein